MPTTTTTPEELLTEIADNLRAGCYLIDGEQDEALVRETLHRMAHGIISTLLKWERLDPIHRKALETYEGVTADNVEHIARCRAGEPGPPVPTEEEFLSELELQRKPN